MKPRKKPIARKTPLKSKGKKKSSVKAPVKKPRQPAIADLRKSAERYCKKWFYKDAVCVVHGWPELENWSKPSDDATVCRMMDGAKNPDWAHIRKRKDRGLILDPRNAITACRKHHNLLDDKGLMDKFIAWKYGQERLDLLDEFLRERHVADYPDLRGVYEMWRDWYKGRTDCFRTWDGEV